MTKSWAPQALLDMKALAADGDLQRTVVLVALQAEGVNDATAEELGELAKQFRQRIQGLVTNLESDERLFTVTEKGGMLRFDCIALDCLAEVGPSAWGQADEMRLESRAAWDAYCASSLAEEPKLWKLWRDEGHGPSPLAVALAGAIWRDVMRKEHHQATAVAGPPPKGPPAPNTQPGHMYPAVSAVVLRRAMEAFFIGKLSVKKVGDEIRLITQRGDDVAVVSPDADVTRALGLANGTRSLLGHRLFRFLVNEGVAAHLLGEGHDHRVLQVEGGLSGLATRLGASGSKAATELRGILDALKFIWIRLPHGETDGLITWTLEHGSPGERALLRIVLNDVLLPGYVTALPKITIAKREARKLVPVPRTLPPLVGHCRTYASQALLQLLVLEEFASRAEELFHNGRVRIHWAKWQALGKEAGLAPERLKATFLAWAHGPTPFLCRDPASGDTFTLAKGLGAELQVLMRSGEKSAKGRARQARLAKLKP